MTPRTIAFAKVVVAVVTLVGIPASRLAQGTTLATLAFHIACAFGVLVVLSEGSLQLVQFILRKGGTDPQWFWLDSERPALCSYVRKVKLAGWISKAECDSNPRSTHWSGYFQVPIYLGVQQTAMYACPIYG